MRRYVDLRQWWTTRGGKWLSSSGHRRNLPAVEDTVLDRLARIAVSDEPRSARARMAANLIRQETGARWVGIYTVAAGTVSNEGWSGPGAPAHPTFPATEGLTGHAIPARAIAMSNDVRRDPRYLTNQDDSGSELIVPVTVAGQVVGTLDVESDLIGAFGATEIAQYERLAQALQPMWGSEAERGPA
jgi:L-methionine (R)-S-oxide reductase